jgi:Tfp pilus assembly protein PilN
MNAIINAVRKRQDLRLTALSILNGVSESIPPRVYPDSIEFSLEQGEQRRVTINGTAESRDDTSLFVRKLEQSPLFRKVTAGPTKKEGEKFRFQIACPMEVSP